MNTKAKTKRMIGKLILYAILVIMAIIFMIPIAWMVSTSFKHKIETLALPPIWIPAELRWENYLFAFENFPAPPLRLIGNTLLIVVVNIVGSVLSNTLVSYAFSRLRWRGRDVWFKVLLATMMIPGTCTMIPTFIMFRNYGWIDTYLPMTIPSFTAAAGTVFLYRQFFTTVPMDVSDSAQIDGAGHFRIWATIVVPMCKPIIVMGVVGTFMGVWNDYMSSLLYLNDVNKFTVAYGLRTFQTTYSVEYNLLMAAALTLSLPTIILFLCFHKHMIEGTVFGALKE